MLRALAIVFAVTGCLALIQAALPWTAGGMQVALAIVLLQAPAWVLHGGTAAEAALGMRFGRWRRSVGLALATMAVVFPLFAVGYHVVHTEGLGLRADWDAAHLVRWDEDHEYAPPAACAARGETTAAWVQGEHLWIVAPPAGELVVTVAAAPAVGQARAVSCARGERPVVEATVEVAAAAEGRTTWRLARGQGLWVPLGERREARIEVSDRGAAVPSERLRLGARGVTADDDGGFALSRSAWWLLTYVLVHLGLVALPEEWFFRGYVQGRLDQVFGTPRRLFGADVGWGLLLGALTFALLHPILLPGVHRLLVFFPALLFGWLRARSGDVGAAILVHAGSNVLLAIVSRMYV